MTDAAILIIRLATGIVMLSHGIGKFQKREILDKKWKKEYNYPIGTVVLAGILQVAGGLALIVGIFTSAAAFILTLNMLVAAYVCIWEHREPFNSVSPGKGWDINLLLLGVLVALILLGDGKWSVMEYLF